MGLNNTSITQRLAMGFGSIFVLLLIIMGTYYFGQQRQLDAMRKLTDEVLPRVDAAHEIKTTYLLESGAARTYIINGKAVWLLEFQDSLPISHEAISRLERLPLYSEGIVLVGEIKQLATKFDQAAEKGIALRQERRIPEGEQFLEGERWIETEMKPVRDQLLAKADEFHDLQNRRRDEAMAQAYAVQATTTQTTMVLALLALVFGSLTATFASRSVTRPVRTLVKASQSLTEGNYEKAISLTSRGGNTQADDRSRDEIYVLGSVFSTMALSLLDRENRLSAKARLSAVLASNVDAQIVAREAIKEVAEYTACEFGAVYSLNSETNSLQRVAAYSLDDAPEAIKVGDGVLGEAVASRRQIVVKNIPAETPFRVRFGFDEVPPKTIVATPMILEKRVIGVMLLGSIRDLSKEALEFLETSVQQIGLSLENALAHTQIQVLVEELQEKNEVLETQNELLQSQAEEIQSQNEELQHQYEEIQSQNEELQGQSEEIQAQSEELAMQNIEITQQSQKVTLLQHITARLSTSLSPQEVLDEVVKGASRLLQSKKTCVFLLDESQLTFYPAASIGFDEIANAGLRLARENSFADHVISEGRTMFLEDISGERNVLLTVLSGGEKVGSLIVTPLRAAGKTLGVLEAYFATPRSFSDDEIGLLTALGATAAVSIRNARLYSAVEQHMRLLDSVLAHVPEAVQVTDATGQVIIANPSALEVFGNADPVLLQKAARESDETLNEVPLDEIWRPTASAMRGERVLAQEIHFCNPESGQEGYAQVSAVPIFDSEGHLDSVVTVAADISRLKEIEFLKDEFLSIASHELKSPLTSLKGFAQVLQTRMEPEKVYEEFRMPLQVIDNQVNKVVRLVNRLLDMSRAQMGRLEIRPEECDLGDLLRKQIQQAQFRKGKHPVVASIDEGMVGYWDCGYIDQVVSNLLDNAYRYSPDGGEISVSLKKTNGTALLTVADQGIGIAKEALPSLFTRYYRAEGAKKVSAEGMGIGLYITHAIIEAHGGKIWVESEQGKGSTFHVELPLEKARGHDLNEEKQSIESK